MGNVINLNNYRKISVADRIDDGEDTLIEKQADFLMENLVDDLVEFDVIPDFYEDDLMQIMSTIIKILEDSDVNG